MGSVIRKGLGELAGAFRETGLGGSERGGDRKKKKKKKGYSM